LQVVHRLAMRDRWDVRITIKPEGRALAETARMNFFGYEVACARRLQVGEKSLFWRF